MGPYSGHTHKGRPDVKSCNCRTGKTARDKASGKHARRLVNRHADPIRESGGKQFGKK